MHGVCTTLITFVFLSHIVPLTVSVVLTKLVICEFRKNRSTFNECMNTRTENQGEKNITKTMIAVNVAFVLLTLPHAVSHTLYIFDACVFEKELNLFFKTVAAYHILNTWQNINFSINIFIYTANIPKFRVSLLNVFKCKCRHQNSGRRNPHALSQSQSLRRNPNFQINSL